MYDSMTYSDEVTEIRVLIDRCSHLLFIKKKERESDAV